MTVGPVEIFVIAFNDPEFHGEIRAELERLRDGDIIRLVDLLAVRKTEDGVIESIQQSDLDADEALAFGAAVGALIGFGAAGEEGMELGAVWGLRELADGHVFDDEDKWRVADAIAPGEGALVALVEHRWAIPVREAVRRAGGHAVAGRWIADQDLIRLGESAIRIPLEGSRLSLTGRRRSSRGPVMPMAGPWCLRQPLLRAFACRSSVRHRTPFSSGASTSSSAPDLPRSTRFASRSTSHSTSPHCGLSSPAAARRCSP